jgi:hypothetical protein
MHDFWYEVQKKAKKYMKERELSSWNEVAVQKDFKPPYVLEGVWAE